MANVPPVLPCNRRRHGTLLAIGLPRFATEAVDNCLPVDRHILAEKLLVVGWLLKVTFWWCFGAVKNIIGPKKVTKNMQKSFWHDQKYAKFWLNLVTYDQKYHQKYLKIILTWPKKIIKCGDKVIFLHGRKSMIHQSTDFASCSWSVFSPVFKRVPP